MELTTNKSQHRAQTVIKGRWFEVRLSFTCLYVNPETRMNQLRPLNLSGKAK
ncbi:hypothetical protein DPMN_131085 [Dreissena polymorpha]|uniref:Uncharacterized protein n=1 Tax=Dreissena polymorpha TaxID=45954 RepID=A0A9D4HC78_DREPO|nr:hypothetical protein DPMN_131085 [Dreissena polymorpha]